MLNPSFTKRRFPESILKEASGVISRLTGCTAVTTTPSGEESRIHRIRFVQTGSHTAMAVVIASNGIIKTKLFRCDFLLNPELLTVFDKAFNEIFSGMKLSSVNRPFIQTAAARLGELSMFTLECLWQLWRLVKRQRKSAFILAV